MFILIYYIKYFIKDRKADLVIHTYVDNLMTSLMEILGIDIDKYDEIKDPTNINHEITDWSIYETDLKKVREIKRNTTKSKKRKKSVTKFPNPESETESPHNNKILKPSKISKLNNIDNIIK